MLFQALEFSKAINCVKRRIWILFHKASNLQNEQSLSFQTLELLKASKFCQKRSYGKLTKRVKFAFSSSRDFKNHHFVKRCVWVFFTKWVDYKMSKIWLLKAPSFISEKLIDWHQTTLIKLVGKDVEKTTKTSNSVSIVFEQKFALENSKRHFWENCWLTSINEDAIDSKRCWEENKYSKSCSNCLRAKVRFGESWVSFLQKHLIKCLEEMLKEVQKQPILCPLFSSKSLPLEFLSSISEKIMHWHQTLTIKTIQKDVERITKTANGVLIIFQQKFAFESFDLNCRENNWLTSKSNVQNDWKRCSEKSKRSKYCPTVFQQKFVFDSFDLHFWENDWLTSNNDDQTDWKILREEQNQKILWPMLFRRKVRFC